MCTMEQTRAAVRSVEVVAIFLLGAAIETHSNLRPGGIGLNARATETERRCKAQATGSHARTCNARGVLSHSRSPESSPVDPQSEARDTGDEDSHVGATDDRRPAGRTYGAGQGGL
jgi:hypothetical protein